MWETERIEVYRCGREECYLWQKQLIDTLKGWKCKLKEARPKKQEWGTRGAIHNRGWVRRRARTKRATKRLLSSQTENWRPSWLRRNSWSSNYRSCNAYALRMISWPRIHWVKIYLCGFAAVLAAFTITLTISPLPLKKTLLESWLLGKKEVKNIY